MAKWIQVSYFSTISQLPVYILDIPAVNLECLDINTVAMRLRASDRVASAAALVAPTRQPDLNQDFRSGSESKALGWIGA